MKKNEAGEMETVVADSIGDRVDIEGHAVDFSVDESMRPMWTKWGPHFIFIVFLNGNNSSYVGGGYDKACKAPSGV